MWNYNNSTKRLTFPRGDTPRIKFTITGIPEGTTPTLTFTMRAKPEKTSPIICTKQLQKVGDFYFLQFEENDTEGQAYGVYDYDIEYRVEGTPVIVQTIIYGHIELTKEVTIHE